MKKLLFVALIGLFLSACGNEETTAPVEESQTVEKSLPNEGLTQDELNEKIKAEAVQADFAELNVTNPPDGKRVYVDGVVSILTKGIIDEFILTAKEGDGYGMYKIILLNTIDAEYVEGDQVRIYGVVNGKDDSGMPQISAPILEKK
jgi:hypothetical protein